MTHWPEIKISFSWSLRRMTTGKRVWWQFKRIPRSVLPAPAFWFVLPFTFVVVLPRGKAPRLV